MKPLTIKTLKNLLRHRGYNSDRDITRAINYLPGKGKAFIDVNAINEENQSTTIDLTPLGVNLAEGDITDVGVILSE